MKIFKAIKEKLGGFSLRRAKKSGLAADSLFFKGRPARTETQDTYPKVLGFDDERPQHYSFVYKPNKRRSDD